MAFFMKSKSDLVIPPKPLPVKAKLIFDLKDGRVRLYPVADTDEDLTHLLAVFREALVLGDLWELIS
jgi:hypothetical protein